MKLSDVFPSIGKPFSYYPAIVHKCNISVNACVLLCYIGWKIYEDETGKWCPLSTATLNKFTGLSQKEQTNARKQLVKEGLLQEKYDRMMHQLFFKLGERDIDIEEPHYCDCGGGESPNAEREDAPPVASAQREVGIHPKVVSSIKGKDSKEQERSTPADAGASPPSPDDIYNSYPKKVGKPKAIQAIRAAFKRGSHPQDLLDQTQAFALGWPKGCNLQYCPMPATWFNQERYNDDPAVWNKADAVKVNGKTYGDQPGQWNERGQYIPTEEEKKDMVNGF